eukprot:TCONS_00006609-protein
MKKMMDVPPPYLFLMLNWSILVVLRWAGDRNYYYSDLTPIDGEAAITMLGNITLWMFNIVFIFMNITEIANRLRGGDVNIHKIMMVICCVCSLPIFIASVMGMNYLSKPHFDRYEVGRWSRVVLSSFFYSLMK